MVWRQMRFQIHDPFPSAPVARHHTRVTLFYTCVWLKHYPQDALLPRYQPLHLPKIGVFAAKRHVRRGLQHLRLVMTEVSMEHLQHKNNSVPHIPFSIGSWDTFPVVVMHGCSRFQPKYKKSVVKVQAITNELGCPLNQRHNYGQMLFGMTMQTPPLSAFAKPVAIFFFGFRTWLPLVTFQHSNICWPAVLGYHDGIW